VTAHSNCYRFTRVDTLTILRISCYLANAVVEEMQVTAKQSGTKYGMLVIWEGATRGSVHNPIASYLVLLIQELGGELSSAVVVCRCATRCWKQGCAKTVFAYTTKYYVFAYIHTPVFLYNNVYRRGVYWAHSCLFPPAF
jgi:hypothetical protein